MHVYILQTIVTLRLLASSRILMKTTVPRPLPSAPILARLPSHLASLMIHLTCAPLAQTPVAPTAVPARAVPIRHKPRLPQQLLLQLQLQLLDQSVPGAQTRQ